MTLGAIDRLVEALNRADIPYCHWKGNYSLARVLAGEKDFELLVDRPALNQTLALLAGLGYKQAIAEGDDTVAGVAHYYGQDCQTGRLSHIHLYSRLVAGEKYIGSHSLPFEAMLLRHGDTIGAVRVPSKPAELIVHTVNLFIQTGSLLDLMNQRRKAEDNSAALRWLQAGSDMSVVTTLLKTYCPYLDEWLFMQCLASLNQPTSLLHKLRLAQQVRGRLRRDARHSDFQRLVAYMDLLGRKGWRMLRRREQRKRLSSGGAVIAFVGPEATGKSTMVETCAGWLGEVFAVRTIHAGKPPATWVTAPVRWFLPSLRRWWPTLRTTRLTGAGLPAEHRSTPAPLKGWPAFVFAVRSVILAWDRQQLLIKSWRAARQGEIVISDRYPSDTIGAMDSPRLHAIPAPDGPLAAVCNWLARLEHKLYEQIPPPDIVLRLHVSMEIARQRNRDRIKVDKESDAYLEARHRQSQDWHRVGTKHVFDIDTEQPLAETQQRVKQLIWESL